MQLVGDQLLKHLHMKSLLVEKSKGSKKKRAEELNTKQELALQCFIL